MNFQKRNLEDILKDKEEDYDQNANNINPINSINSIVDVDLHISKQRKIDLKNNVNNLTFVLPPPSFKDLLKKLEQLTNDGSGEQLISQHYHTTEARAIFNDFFQLCISKNLLSGMLEGIRLYLKYLLILLKHYNVYQSIIEDEILYLYNISSMNDLSSIEQILLADFNQYNKSFLGSIKILALQCILKRETAEANMKEESELIVQLFANDDRFFIRLNLKLKPGPLLKTIFHLIIKYKDIRVPLSLKILQYIEQFQLKFEDYTKSTTKTQFAQNIKFTNYPDWVKLYIPGYYQSYCKYFPKGPSLSLHEIYSKRRSLIQTANPDLRTVQEDDWHYKIKETLNKPLQDNLEMIYKYVERISFCGYYDKSTHLKDFDRIVLNINTNASKINKNDFNMVCKIIKRMEQFFLNHNDLKRVGNIINLSFNLYIILTFNDFLKEAVVMNLNVFSLVSKKENYEIWSKFHKFISCAYTGGLKLWIFEKIFNVFALFFDESLDCNCKFVIEYCVPLFKLIANTTNYSYVEFRKASELMLCLLYSQIGKVHNVPFANWSLLTQMLYQSLDSKTEISYLQIDVPIDKYDTLYREEVLIKCIYLIYLEMKKRSCLNLKKIYNIYTKKWLSTKVNENRCVNIIENKFLKTLLIYLEFNKFNHTIKKFCEVYKKYYPSNIQLLLTEYLLRSCNQLNSITFDVTLTKPAIHFNFTEKMSYYNTLLSKYVYDEDLSQFLLAFSSKLPVETPELFDISNKNRLCAGDYIQVIMFNIHLYLANSYLQSKKNNYILALTNSKKVLVLCNSLVKKMSKLNQELRLQLTTALLYAFRTAITVSVHLGLVKECEFYVKQFYEMMWVMSDPIVTFELCHYSILFYKLLGEQAKHDFFLSHLLKISTSIDMEENVDAKCKFLYDTNMLGDLQQYCLETDPIKPCGIFKDWLLDLGSTRVNKFFQHDARYIFNDLVKDITDFIELAREKLPYLKRIEGAVWFGQIEKYQTTRSFNVNSHANQDDEGKILKKILDIQAKISSTHNFDKMSFVLQKKTVDYVNWIISFIERWYKPLNFTSIITLEGLKNKTMRHEKELVLNDSDLDFDPKNMNKYARLSENFPNDFCGVNVFPSEYNVITLDVCGFTGDLVMEQFKHGVKRNIRLPTSRLSQFSSSPTFTFNNALKELKNIIDLSNETTSSGVTSNVVTKEDRRAWWKKRFSLDTKLHNLLKEIEIQCFGGFVGIFNNNVKDRESKEFAQYRKKFHTLLRKATPGYEKRYVPDDILELFLLLDLNVEHIDLLLQDLIQFIHNRAFHKREKKYNKMSPEDFLNNVKQIVSQFSGQVPSLLTSPKHIILVVKDLCHAVPWESCNFLRDKSVSRISSLCMLKHLLDKFGVDPVLDTNLDSLSVVLNPNGDLPRTENNFKDYFSDVNYIMVSVKPSPSDFQKLLMFSSLFIYIGHSGGEQYIKLKDIKKLDIISSSFLLGCSSAYMVPYKEFSNTGTVMAYILGGSPMIVGNLWDVTDKDIDRYSLEMFSKIGLLQENLGGKLTVAQAIADSRAVCKLRYLNGAAPIIYGLPFKVNFRKN
ncbi:separase SCDLUD_002335 [Saccharomycodes ludwigii]|uniref:separase n=1 Tax=Saccharomycodes ludwigii TaxID=36035 RepID=UPI001E89EF77|nr:hypothetical protein SCDLUD_002335 [Saccharomycodes ludwigii]KAH3900878.1 hypothetical protein SCDLUD_002335 [Saccharomycodes ludwigii]